MASTAVTPAPLVFVDEVEDDVARLVAGDRVFDLPLALLPNGVREGQWVRLSESLTQDEEDEDDWGATVSDVAPLVEALATRQGQRIIYSALRCYSDALLASPGPITFSAYRRVVRVNTMSVDRLERAQIVPLACDAWPVERLVQCLGILPAPECSADPDLALQVKVATRLETMISSLARKLQ